MIRRLLGLCLLIFFLPGPPASALRIGVAGPADDNVDDVPSTRLPVTTPFSGPIDALTVSVTTDAVFADELTLILHHNGRSAKFYVGQGRTEDALITATFADDVDDDYPTSGSVSGGVNAAPDPLSVFDGSDVQGLWELEIQDPSGNMDGTQIIGWAISVNTGASGPSRRVALFFNGSFVDTQDNPNTLGADAEALNLLSLLGQGAGDPGEKFGGLGHQVTTFTGTSQSAIATALAGKEVLVIPSLEGPGEGGASLIDALDATAEAEIRNFVQNGGILITNSTLFGHNSNLLDGVFGYSTSVEPSLSGFLQDAAVGTPFQGAPGVISPGSFVSLGLQNLPANARVMYEGPGTLVGSSTNPVVVIDEGAGKIVWLAYTFDNAFPEGTSGFGWDDILDRAVKDDLGALFTAQSIALFDDGAFVDTAAGEESDNVQAVLAAYGHNVSPFTGTSVSAWSNALTSADTLLIPELEIADLEPALASGARDAITNFVDGGGVIVVHSESSINLINSLFGFMNFAGTPGEGFKTNSVVATPFFNVVNSVDENTTVDALSLDDLDDPDSGAGLPVNAYTIFSASGNDATAAAMLFGAGRVVWLGWDFSNAKTSSNPSGQDGGWFDTLDRAVTAVTVVPEPGASAAFAALALAFAALRTRRRR